MKKDTIDGKVEYLQMIQEPICRMSTTSAIFKGFSATIVAGIALISYKDISTVTIALSFVPVVLFFLLDMYYLQLEKLYRYLYDEVRQDIHPIDFSMQLPQNKKAAEATFWQCFCSKSIWMFYPFMIAILIVVVFLDVSGGI